MRTKKQVIRRINILYAVFFAAIIASLTISMTSDESRAAFRDGYNRGSAIGMPVTSNIFYGIQNKTSKTGFIMPLKMKTVAGEITGSARVSSFEVELRGQGVGNVSSGWNAAAIVFSTVCYLTVFIMIFIILSSLRSSVKKGDIFEKRNIKRTRAIGILLIAASLLNSLSMWLENRAMDSVIASDPAAGFVVNTAFGFSSTEIITAILILFIAEIFAIGHYLTEEQKLTI